MQGGAGQFTEKWTSYTGVLVLSIDYTEKKKKAIKIKKNE